MGSGGYQDGAGQFGRQRGWRWESPASEVLPEASWPHPVQQVTNGLDLAEGCSPDQGSETSLIRFIDQVLTCTNMKEIPSTGRVKPSLLPLLPGNPARAGKLSQGLCLAPGVRSQGPRGTFPKVLFQLAELSLGSKLVDGQCWRRRRSHSIMEFFWWE